MTTIKKAPSTKKKTKKREEKERGKWIDSISGVTKDSKPYSIKDTFHLNDLIDHPKFGAGVVSELLTETTIKVTFRDGDKVLVHSK